MNSVKRLKNLFSILLIYAAKLIRPNDNKRITYKKRLKLTTSQNTD